MGRREKESSSPYVTLATITNMAEGFPEPECLPPVRPCAGWTSATRRDARSSATVLWPRCTPHAPAGRARATGVA